MRFAHLHMSSGIPRLAPKIATILNGDAAGWVVKINTAR